MAELRGRWWNQKWGTMSRQDIWLRELDDGRLEVTWRGGDWRDRDGVMTTNDPSMATAAVRKLVEDSGGLEEFGGPWREMPLELYR